MSTRASRRSAGGADGLNRAMINLLPVARLKEECEKRGLPIDGNKQALSSRLEDSLDGIYVPPSAPATQPSTLSTPSTSRNSSANNSAKTRNNSAKSTQAKRTPRRKTNSTGEAEKETRAKSPPKKKTRRSSIKQEPSRENSACVKEEEIIEEEFSVTVVAPQASVDDKFDSDDDQPLIRVVPPTAVAAAESVAAVAPDKEKEEEKEQRKQKKKRKRKEDEDRETGAVLEKGDSEWKPDEEEKKGGREERRKRTRRSTIASVEEGHSESPGSSMPKLDPEIFDEEGKDEEEEKREKRERKTSEGGKKDNGESNRRDSESASERPRSISLAGAAAGAAAAAKEKEKRRDTTAATIVRPKEKPATQRYAEIMNQKKEAARKAAEAAAAAAAATTTARSAAASPVSSAAAAAAVLAKLDEKGSSEDSSPRMVEKKNESSSRRDSISAAAAAVGSPVAAADGSAANSSGKGFSMAPRKNAPPRPAVPAGGSDLLGDLLGKQQDLLQKVVRSTAETAAEKQRIVSQINQRAPDLRINEDTVKEEKERMQKEREEREKAREEREKKERERKAAALKALHTPPPPPPPPILAKKEVEAEAPSESPAAAAASAAPAALPGLEEVKKEDEEEEIEEYVPQYVPASKDVSMVDDTDDGPEYEPLSPGITMPALDRSITEAHHRQRKEREEKKKSGQLSLDHGLVALEAPFSANDPFLLRLSDKLKMIKKQRDEAAESSGPPVDPDVRACMDSLLRRVEEKVEKEMKWEKSTKRRSEYQMEREKEEKKRAQLMLDPRALLAKATNILQSMKDKGSVDDSSAAGAAGGSPTDAAKALEIAQHIAEPGTYDEDVEDRPLPEFHGEPVPSDDEEALFLEAAGLPKKDKRPKHPVVEEEAPPSHEHIQMDYYNACLHIKSATDKPWLIEPDNENGLALMWGGVRSNHGYVLPWREEKSCLVFQIKIVEHQSIRHIPFNEQDPYDVRVGFSLRASPNIMGEQHLSWAFSTTGKKCVNNVFQEWGDPFEIGDVLTAVMDFTLNSISYYKNGESMGVAFKDLNLPDGDAVYAHVCVKNCKVAVNLGSFPSVDGGWSGVEGEGEGKREGGWMFPSEIERKRYEMSRLPPGEKAACTLLMMCGLPGVGKTTWVRQYTRDHPDEKWDVINAEGVMAAMKVNGVARGRAHIGRWDMVLGLVAKALQKMVLLAARRRRNYIVDLSNVNKDSRKRRLMHFKDFTKKCIVIVPDEEEMVNRQMKQSRSEGASHVPAEAILEMKAVYTLPSEETEEFDDVILVEPCMSRIAEAIEIIQRFNDEGKPWYQKRYRGRGRGGRRAFMNDRRGSDLGRPLSVSTGGLNGSGPSTNVGGGRSMASPAAWGNSSAESPITPSGGGGFTWANRKNSR